MSEVAVGRGLSSRRLFRTRGGTVSHCCEIMQQSRGRHLGWLGEGTLDLPLQACAGANKAQGVLQKDGTQGVVPVLWALLV